MYTSGTRCVVVSGELNNEHIQVFHKLIGCGINVYPPLSVISRSVSPYKEHQPVVTKEPRFTTTCDTNIFSCTNTADKANQEVLHPRETLRTC